MMGLFAKIVKGESYIIDFLLCVVTPVSQTIHLRFTGRPNILHYRYVENETVYIFDLKQHTSKHQLDQISNRNTRKKM